MFGRTPEPPVDPLFHPPRGPLEVSDRVDEIDHAIERDKKSAAPRAVFAALSFAALSSNSGFEPVQRVSVWTERDHFDR
jgi:hypothetical protein